MVISKGLTADQKKILTMTYREWLPSLWEEARGEAQDPLSALRKQIETVFHDFERGSPARAKGFSVSSNVSEKDIDVSVSANRITIKGKKKIGNGRKERTGRSQFLRLERSSGSFERSMNLPFDIDPDAVEAEFKKGVLTVTIPKPPEVAEKRRRIEIRKPS